MTNTSWRRIGQDASPRTRRAWRRLLLPWGVFLGSLLGVFSLVLGVHYLLLRSDRTVKIEPYSLELHTSGTLSLPTLKKHLGQEVRSPFMRLDLFALKRHIERLSQVKEAQVTRVFPATLRFDITEHEPAFRLGSASGDLRLVSQEGQVFCAQGLSRRALLHLPVLTELTFHEDDGRVDGIAILVALKHALLRHSEALGLPLQAVSIACRDFLPKNLQDPRCVLFLKGPNAEQWCLAPHDFDGQLKRLSEVLVYSAEHRLAFSCIDLSISQTQVIATP